MFECQSQGGIIEQAGCQPQNGVPGFLAAGNLSNDQPVGERLLWPSCPFGDLRQALPPRQVVGRLPHGRGRDFPRIFELAVIEKSLETERVDAVVERQLWLAP